MRRNRRKHASKFGMPLKEAEDVKGPMLFLACESKVPYNGIIQGGGEEKIPSLIECIGNIVA